jgi:hypothetical protein
MHAIHNARIQLLANLLNTIAGVSPSVATMPHLAAQRVLGSFCG